MPIVGDYRRTGTVRWQDSLSVRHESIASDERSTLALKRSSPNLIEADLMLRIHFPPLSVCHPAALIDTIAPFRGLQTADTSDGFNPEHNQRYASDAVVPDSESNIGSQVTQGAQQQAAQQQSGIDEHVSEFLCSWRHLVGAPAPISAA
jgi:hypothetical protein